MRLQVRADQSKVKSGKTPPSKLEEAALNDPEKKLRLLVKWNADLLERLLQAILTKRQDKDVKSNTTSDFREKHENGTQFIDLVVDSIPMPSIVDEQQNISSLYSMDLGRAERQQLYDYVFHIAALYQNNAFHSFDHASHVVMSTHKLVMRIVDPDSITCGDTECSNVQTDCTIRRSKDRHQMTYGISSDPLMQFAIVFAALVHDVGHTGLTNQQLVKQNHPLAIQYRGRCVAEQHSLQMAWNMLMEKRFTELRRCIYSTEAEKQRFRQLLTNAIIATDISDKELNSMRKIRWEKAFSQAPTTIPEEAQNCLNRKATIVLEYIIQASDVAHTMQAWQVYQDWNKRLFVERYSAYLAGRESEDPSIGWYKGEIWFFEHYVIPLAKQLRECNMLRETSLCDEYLMHAIKNLYMWKKHGNEIVVETLRSCHLAMENHPVTPSKHYASFEHK